jgi:hypothetical protein
MKTVLQHVPTLSALSKALRKRLKSAPKRL